MKVDYVDHMGDDLSVINAAKASFEAESEWETVKLTGKKILSGKDTRLIYYLARGWTQSEWSDLMTGICLCNSLEDAEDMVQSIRRRATHFAPFTHPQISLRLEVPMFVARQLDKHQIGFATSEKSRRYRADVPVLEEIDWRSKPQGNIKQGSGEEFELPQEAEAAFVSAQHFALDAYENLLDAEAAPEQARAVLPMNTPTIYTKTASLFAWARLYNLRIDSHAQKETRDVAVEIGKIVEPLFPVSWKALTE